MTGSDTPKVIRVTLDGATEDGPFHLSCTIPSHRVPGVLAALYPKESPAILPKPFSADQETEAERFILDRKPANFSETIALAARYLTDRRGFDSFTRADLRDVLRASPAIRMPRNFNRDFSIAVDRGYFGDLGDGRHYRLTGPG